MANNTTNDIAFAGDIPTNYERYMRPIFFEKAAQDIASRVPSGAREILEVAAGTGIVTESLRAKFHDAHIVSTDLSEGMLEVARQKTNVTGVEFRQADALELPFNNDSFDAGVCQFGLMFFPDKDQAAREAYRVLKAGGAYLLSTWNQREKNPIADAANDVCRSFFETDPPAFYEVPFSMYDKKELDRILRDAGFKNIRVEEIALKSRAQDGASAAKGLLEGNPIILDILERAPEKLEPMKAKLAAALEEKFGKPVVSDLSAIVCVGTK